jgi:hypothetical protein
MGEGKMRVIIGAKEIAGREIANAGQLRSWMRNGGEEQRCWKCESPCLEKSKKKDGVLNCCKWVRDGRQAVVAPDGGE